MMRPHTKEHNARIAAAVKRHWETHLTSRGKARVAGEKFFVPDVSCESGHRLRYVSDGWCVECAQIWGRSPERRLSRVLCNAKGRAKQECLPFDLTLEYLTKIWPADNLCPIMRTPLTEPTGPFRHGPRPFSPSVDRIIPELGYVKGNIAIISLKANTLKNNCTDPAVFRRLADWLEKVKH
jgi:hypothetical protein